MASIENPAAAVEQPAAITSEPEAAAPVEAAPMESVEAKPSTSKKKAAAAPKSKKADLPAPVSSNAKVTKAKAKTTPATTSSSSSAAESVKKVARVRNNPNYLEVPKLPTVVGFVFGAGSNPTGELGVHPDEVQQKLRPAPIKGLEAVEIVDIACGGMHTMALTKEGKV